MLGEIQTPEEVSFHFLHKRKNVRINLIHISLSYMDGDATFDKFMHLTAFLSYHFT